MFKQERESNEKGNIWPKDVVRLKIREKIPTKGEF